MTESSSYFMQSAIDTSHPNYRKAWDAAGKLRERWDRERAEDTAEDDYTGREIPLPGTRDRGFY